MFQNTMSGPFEYHQQVELVISDITNQGWGIGRIDGWVVMVPFVCIGETVIARIYKNFSNYSIADLVEIVNESRNRVRPRCKHFGVCGGCQYQHIAYAAQLELKRKQVSDIFGRIGDINFPVNECIYSEPQYGYRSKITPHFQKKIPPIGFLKNGSNRCVVDIDECQIASYCINSELKKVREDLLRSNQTKKRGGTLLFRDTGGKVEINPRSVICEQVKDFSFFHYAGEFFQNNPFVLPKMIDFVLQKITGPKFLVDTYCGVGVFGICAAKFFEKVIGIEINDKAICLAKRNAEENGIKNINFIAGDAQEIFKNVEVYSNDACVIIDPPRTGCSGEFLALLKQFSPAKIVYISCAPDTQARDLKLLVPEYNITEVQPIDMFPQTRHIENVVVLSKKDNGHEIF